MNVKEINVSKECSKLVESLKPEMVDWGFAFLVHTQLEALQIAYAYRNCKHGVKVEFCIAPNKFLVTVFNEVGAKAGLNK